MKEKKEGKTMAKEKIKDNIHGFGRGAFRQKNTWLVFLGVILFSPFSFVASAEPPNEKECLFYGYSSSFNHYFLLEDNAVVFGTNLTFVNNCEKLTIYTDDNFLAQSENGSTVYVNLFAGTYNFTINADGKNYTINNAELLPNALTWYGDYNDWKYGDFSLEALVELSYAEAQENWASFLTAVIIWVLTVFVYWNLINSYVDRNYAEEVRK